MDDKERERQRYDDRAVKARDSLLVESAKFGGAASITRVLRAPYECYEAILEEILKPDAIVLEIGSGTGEFTGALIRSGAKVVATDISPRSLELLRMRYVDKLNISTITCDMEAMPFYNESFDAVSCAGSLSYGDNDLVMNEIYRVLKKNGVFISVDSLNHNIIYRINRRIQYYANKRTLSTIKRMPRIHLYSKYIDKFSNVELKFFGSVSWLMPFFSKLFGEEVALAVSNYVDGLVRVRKSAFKVVMVAHKDE
jgi:ubiquinone/menaquinone biosynthesis C-methylase UbiE